MTINSEEEYDNAVEEMDALVDIGEEDATPEQAACLEELTSAVERYEDIYYPILDEEDDSDGMD